MGLSLIQKLKRLKINKLYSIEIAVIISFFIALTFLFIFNLKFYFPNLITIKFIFKHYLGPLFIAVLLIIIYSKASNINNLILKNIRFLLAFLCTIFLHFNFKLWAMLINVKRYDILYHKIDIEMIWLINKLNLLRKSYAKLLDHINAYHELFVLMFLLSFIIYSKRHRLFQEVILSTSLALLIGGITYSFFPAIGPFIYEKSPDFMTAKIQSEMFKFHYQFIESNGNFYNGNFFVSALAAMPSLHIANATIFTYYAFKYSKLFYILNVLLLCFFMVESVVLKWHYIIDIPAGFFVAIV